MRWFLFLAPIIFLVSCVNDGCYPGGFLSFTNYDLDDYREQISSGGIRVFSNSQVDFSEIDRQTDELEICLGINIERSCFVVLIPDDWFWSDCSEEQLLPYAAPIEFCRDKGLDIPEYCSGVSLPTDECPCTCNWRIALQDDFIIVTTPNLRLYKAELARLVTNVNNPWTDDNILRCLN